MADGSAEGYRIGEVSRRTGVSEASLRAWEQRYNLLRPVRTGGNHRRYGDDDVARVLSVVRLVEQGWSVAAAAKQVLDAEVSRPGPRRRMPALRTGTNPRSPGRLARTFAERFAGAMEQFDLQAAYRILREAADALDPFAVFDDVLSVEAARLAAKRPSKPTQLVRRAAALEWLKAQALTLGSEQTRTGRRGSSVAVCLEGGPEEVFAALVSAALGSAGWPVVYLGVDASAAEAGACADVLPRPVLVVHAASRPLAERALRLYGGVDAPLLLSGRGFRPTDAGPGRVWLTGPLRGVGEAAEAASRTYVPPPCP